MITATGKTYVFSSFSITYNYKHKELYWNNALFPLTREIDRTMYSTNIQFILTNQYHNRENLSGSIWKSYSLEVRICENNVG